MGDDLYIVNGQVACGTSPCPSEQVGYLHLRLGGRRFASFWAKSAGGAVSSGTIYYHRDMRGSVVATTTSGGIEANS